MMVGGYIARVVLASTLLATHAYVAVSASASPKTFTLHDATFESSVEHASGVQTVISASITFEERKIASQLYLPFLLPNGDHVGATLLRIDTFSAMGGPCNPDVQSLTAAIERAQATNTTCFAFNLSEQPIPTLTKMPMSISVTWVDISRPLPAKIDASDTQSIVTEIPVLLDLPGCKFIGTSTQTVRFPNGRIHSFGLKTSDPYVYPPIDKSYNNLFSKSGSSGTVTVSEKDVNALLGKTIYLHYEFAHPVIVASSLRRVIDVSHLTNIATITDYFVLHNTGAELSKPFSRIEYMFNPHQYRAVLRGINTLIPRTAFNIDYRDDVGNVSTSSVLEHKDALLLVATPRYPVFGGWNYKFYQSYQLPLSELVKVDENTGRNIATLPALPQTVGFPYRKVELVFVMPQGAAKFKISVDFPYANMERDTTYSYFDTTGRETFTFTMYNVFDLDIYKSVEISYTYNVMSVFLTKVSVVTASTFLLFVAVSLLTRIDLSSAWTASKLASNPVSQSKKDI